MNVTVFGTGYVGLVTGCCLAEVGNKVTCVDVDQAKLQALRRGEVPIHEPGLESLLKGNAAAGRLHFSGDPAQALAGAEVAMICVGTPPSGDGSVDMSYVLQVARDIGDHLSGPCVVVNKSTVPVGTVDRVAGIIAQQLRERGVEFEVDVVSNPEFLKEGAAVKDCMKPDRIVIGAEREHPVEVLRRLYAPFNRNHERIFAMDPRSAELTKYVANAMLAAKISLMNEFANIAERVGADIEMVRQGVGADPRIGPHFIYAGIGYGGSCFPKDVLALEHTARSHGYPARLLEAVENVNAAQKRRAFERLLEHFGGSVAGRCIALWGLAFKPNTDDMREAPSRVLMEQLWQAGATVQAYDPAALAVARQMYGERADLRLFDSAEAAAMGADALVLVTEWKEFWAPDFARLRACMRGAVLVDGRNIYDPAQAEAAGFTYYGIGRGRKAAA